MVSPYHTDVPDADEFTRERHSWRESLSHDKALRKQAVALHMAADRHHFGYQWEWCGVPIIRLPEDIVLQQEIVWALRPSCIIETGVARGGSLVLSASLMSIAGLHPAVLGLDIKLFPHTRTALMESPFNDSIQTWEGDSAGAEARDLVSTFLRAQAGGIPALLVLDSNHTHDHVLAELSSLAPLLPGGSVVLVADTIVEEMPENYYADRPWGRGNNPATAVQAFLRQNRDFSLDNRWTARGLLTEVRNGVIVRREDAVATS